MIDEQCGKLYAGKPIIGLAGGIGSGKSTIADLFGELGCLVIHSDQQVKLAYADPRVRSILKQWWGDSVFTPSGEVDRKAVASRIFADESERHRLEELLHPLVGRQRHELMERAANDAQVPAYVWDAPLLFETGLHKQCDTVVFVQAPLSQRSARVAANRGWDEAELARREKLQWPLDSKREISEYVIDNTADADYARGQVKEVLSRIQARWCKTLPGD
jgi:dephospho-CoA kinase